MTKIGKALNLKPQTLNPRSRDRLSKARRSWNMSRIPGKDTNPELIVRRLLHKMGYRFRLHVRILVEVGRVAPRAPRVGRSGNGAHGVTRPTQLKTQNSKLKTAKSVSSARLSTINSRLSTKFVRPDIVLPRYKTAIFVHGCFWHRHKNCKDCTTPTHRREWWLEKLNGNAERDKRNQRALKKLGWRVIVIWECQTGGEKLLRKVTDSRFTGH